MDETPDTAAIRGWFRKRFVLYALFALLVVGVVAAWFTRYRIADDLVQRELVARGIDATYTIERIGLNRQVIRDLVIGDPKSPDLIAERIEIGNWLSTSGAGVEWVSARNVRVFGEWTDGRLSFGQLDRFAESPDDSPFELPDLWLGVNGGRMLVRTPAGDLAASLSGQGELRNGFAGRLGIVSDALVVNDCRATAVRFAGAVRIDQERPILNGPLRAAGLQCADADLSSRDLLARLDVAVAPRFDGASGKVDLMTRRSVLAGRSAGTVRANLRFDSSAKRLTARGTAQLQQVNAPEGSVGEAEFTGQLALVFNGQRLLDRLSGRALMRDARLASSYLTAINDLPLRTGSTPFGPVATDLAQKVRRAARSFDLRADVAMNEESAAFELANLNLASRNGLRLTTTNRLLFDPGKAAFAWPGGMDVRVLGGGLPPARLALAPGAFPGQLRGSFAMQAYRVGSSALTIDNLQFAARPGGGSTISGLVHVTGPFQGGHVDRLRVPINAAIGRTGEVALFPECMTASYAGLRYGSLVSQPNAVRICPERGAVARFDPRGGLTFAGRVERFDWRGTVGGTPLSVASAGARIDGVGLRAEDVAVRLGGGSSQSELDIKALAAQWGRTTDGTLSGARSKIGNVPLLLREIAGEWRFADGVLTVDGSMTVRDAAEAPRFEPLAARNVKLTFDGSRIDADATLREPQSDSAITDVVLTHRLATGRGNARLAVDRLEFDDTLQPSQITPLALGVVANVDGRVSGDALIEWDTQGDGVTSTGRFRTDNMNLAAAFGPVTGLSTEIVFSDLLALETAPGQRLTVKEVNPGVAAFDGKVSYRILPDLKLGIEGGEWPFAGGTLSLEPTILDFSDESERRLEFAVSGLDAAQFLSRFDFENITATGVFDGKLPMVFDKDGGRIVGGYLVARDGGGTIAYVGELTYEDLGTMANFAFNALKSLRYEQLTIGMNGDIDGEIITEVRFSGLRQGEGAATNFITRQLAKLPVEFNVRIEAPFMQLLTSARAFYEPDILVEQNLPALLRAQEARAQEAAQEIERAE